MKLLERAQGVATSPTTGRAMKVVKVLNLIGTVRGAVTTVLLAMGLVGGAATVNNVREDVVERVKPSADVARPSVSRPPATPAPTPLTGAALRADLQNRLQATLTTDAQAVEDLRKVAIISGDPLDQLIADAKQRLQTRYDQGIAQLTALLAPTPTASASGAPSPSVSVVTANALYQVIKSDLDQIVVVTTRAATSTPPPRPGPPTPPPTPTGTHTPTATPVRTLPPTPTPTPRITPRPTPTPTR